MFINPTMGTFQCTSSIHQEKINMINSNLQYIYME